MNSTNNHLSSISNWILITIAVLASLLYFENFLKSLVIAILIWYLIKKLRDSIAKLKWGKVAPPKWLITISSTVVIFLIIYLITQIISSNIQKLAIELPRHSDNIKALLRQIESALGIDDLEKSFSILFDQYKNEIISYAGSFAGAIGKSIMVLVYVVFILMEESLFGKKIKKVLETTPQGSNIHKVGAAITLLFDKYLSVKIFTSFITGVLSYFVLLIIGVELAGLWAFLIFLFNFIPTVGSIIATAFPSLFAIVQFGGFHEFAWVLTSVGAIQLLVGNLIEPRIMGNRLNISPMVVLIGLTLWGFIWGVTGMLLSVPITATFIIIFSQFNETKALAILLSKNGEIGLVDQSEPQAEVN
ncbi:AI-2E family transporter [Reichenbachiella ulvae]|uniref:AI-2E family transporter n=1 Tax=Reichenbachiella ulvae TaxID=2980104 RepID=A0ABT3CT91_9BACT|nr:AI-2E family transporter [Reichenbachiella ulvae]MCV9386907.1 AI-2E family transporter [Reichenbachiella ulvae]